MRVVAPSSDCPLAVRVYEASCAEDCEDVILLHGGPAAAGYLAPVARGLQKGFQPAKRILEPFQRGATPTRKLTVAQHVDDLHQLIGVYCNVGRVPHIVGHSWGAMLGLVYAATFPENVASLSLIGCGSFTLEARQQLMETVDARITEELHAQFTEIMKISDPDLRLCVMGDAISAIYGFDYTQPCESARCDAKAHEETWDDMIKCQDEGLYPRMFSSVAAPVMMFHGLYDPHPAQLIEESLLPYIPHLRSTFYECCGHDIWREESAFDLFFGDLGNWVSSPF